MTLSAKYTPARAFRLRKGETLALPIRYSDAGGGHRVDVLAVIVYDGSQPPTMRMDEAQGHGLSRAASNSRFQMGKRALSIRHAPRELCAESICSAAFQSDARVGFLSEYYSLSQRLGE
jgi:hypothetical protein